MGWRNTTVYRNFDGDTGFDQTFLVLRAQVVCTLTNGTQLTLSATGGAEWTAAKGPVIASSVFNGEDYDARRAAALAGWDTPAGPVTKGQFSPAHVLEATEAPSGLMLPWSDAPVIKVGLA